MTIPGHSRNLSVEDGARIAFVVLMTLFILGSIGSFLVICIYKYIKSQNRNTKTEILGRIMDIDAKRQEQHLKSGITIGQEVPKFIPLKQAAIKKEYIDDFTPEELEQFKSDLKPEYNKKVYRIIQPNKDQPLKEENHGFEMNRIDHSLFPNITKNLKDEGTYLNYPSKAPEQ
mmetsp:Transcript_3825/g.3203  ORF Transcript_3825/g.3203 Transcript_3825/m.3203 type:complete len:173 (+) Transcript_3825:104-622(+)